jgi:putative nucleotidyltransferase with HDIG domain
VNSIDSVRTSQALKAGPGTRAFEGLHHRLRALRIAIVGPEFERSPPVTYTPAVVVFVSVVVVAAITVAATTIQIPSDLTGLVLVSAVIFLMSATGVRTIGRSHQQVFSATTFLNVGLILTLGPAGGLGAVAEATGVAIRHRTGLFRYVFNLASLFLSSLSAWATFRFLTDLSISGVLWIGFCGLAAGFAMHVVNHLLLAGILSCATGRHIRTTLRGSLDLLPYNLAYGYAAIAFVAVHERFGPLGFTFALAPVVALQAFLMVLAHRTNLHEAQRDQLMDRLMEKSIQVERSYDATLVALTHALDARDKETEGHSRRVVEYTRLIAVQLGIAGEELKLLCHGALLHDIGKIGVPDAILHKPDKLTEAEWQIMRRHPEIGAAMVDEVEYLAEARRIILHHHERWDGRGYPLGLRGSQITLGARAFAVSDTFDAITQDRPYRRGRSFDEAREEIVRHRATQFDPDAVDAFLTLDEGELRRIAAIRSRVGLDLLALRPPAGSPARSPEQSLLLAG